MLLVIDNTSNCKRSVNCKHLVTILSSNNIEFVVVKTIDEIIDVHKNKGSKSTSGIILTGSETMLTETIDINKITHCMYALMHFKVPVLGICFGAQLLHVLHGGRLERLEQLQCKKILVTLDASNPLFRLSEHTKEKQTSVHMRFCYNDQMISEHVTTCKPIAFMASTKSGERIPCAYKYNDHPWYGILFHPEYYSHTHYVILNFVDMCLK